MSLSPSTHWRCVFGILLALYLCLGVPAPANADDATTEHARLAAVLRHVDAIDRLVAEAGISRDERARYHFDYARLTADLERVRAGIRDYLSPPRAQPRDPSDLLGDYRQPTAAPREPEAAP
ncbi:Candidate type III effector Hop protein [plant metagenome]|uniref:Candidate type III effector Hop protein n=1 Tax=plant metagenome TaxID=1297885 RepID=A0A484Q5M5_9ZZZZ